MVQGECGCPRGKGSKSSSEKAVPAVMAAKTKTTETQAQHAELECKRLEEEAQAEQADLLRRV